MRRIAAIALVTPLFAAPAVAPAHAAAPAAPASAPVEQVVSVPLETGPGEVHAAATKKVSIKTQEQQKYYWCAPAAGRALLSAYISRGLPSQSKLAGWMGTKPPDGTWETGMRNGLRKALQTYAGRPYEVVVLNPKSQSAFLTNVKAAVGSKKKPLIYRVLVGHKPWGRTTGNKAGHFMVVYGYTTGSNPKILWWDPADNTRRTASLSKSWASVKKAGHRGTTAVAS